MARNLLPCQFV